MEKRKRVLIVAAEFPPFKTIGRIRTLKLCQHLLEWGWSPLVLTVSASAEGPYDELTLAEIPSGLPVYRAHWPQPENQVIRLA
ncbi:MAG: hypothetical protein HY695_04985 [Deltaproteobacteria bacterium]|nr:hypothetical protein [Deltaproteobacteria bacterium]